MNKQGVFLSILLAGCVGLSFIAGFVVGNFNHPSSEYPVLQEVIEIIAENGLQPLPEKTSLEYGMIRGMLQVYDDLYTIFVDPPHHELQTNELEGAFGGIGVKLERGEGGHIILYPFPDSPAAKAGIQNRDWLISVDDLEVNSESSFDIIEAAIRGPVDTTVKVIISRPESSNVEFIINREEIAIPSVIWHLAEGAPEIGLLQVTIFANTTPDEIIQAVKALQALGVTDFILDLRGNGGGLLDAGIETARLFLQEGTVIEQQSKGEEITEFSVDQPGPLANIPLVVLVNHQTASAAEIVAGALQANHRASLVGEPTYGKNTIQLVFQLQDGSSLHITSAHWWFPNLEFPRDGYGLKPDIISSSDQSLGDTYLRMAVEMLIENR